MNRVSLFFVSSINDCCRFSIQRYIPLLQEKKENDRKPSNFISFAKKYPKSIKKVKIQMRE